MGATLFTMLAGFAPFTIDNPFTIDDAKVRQERGHHSVRKRRGRSVWEKANL